MRRIPLALLLLVACGSGIGGAGDCTELFQATIAAVNELPDSHTDEFSAEWEELTHDVEARAQDLVGPAPIEIRAMSEAVICTEAMTAAHLPMIELLNEIADGLREDRTSP